MILPNPSWIVTCIINLSAYTYGPFKTENQAMGFVFSNLQGQQNVFVTRLTVPKSVTLL